MLPGQTSLKTLRDAQRARSLGLNAQQRQHLTSGAGARASSSASSAKLGGRLRAQGKGAGVVWKGVQSAAERQALEEEVREGRGLGSEVVAAAERGAQMDSEEEEREQQGRLPEKGAVEVPLQELVRPARGRHLSGDFEIIRGVKGVIALEEDEFGAASLAELGVAEEGDEEDEWELLGLEDEEEGVSKEVKPQGKSWASIVGRS